MAHFARIDDQNKVVEVLVLDNSTIGNLEFPLSELPGVTFLQGLFPGTNWKQTSYNSNFRFAYAGQGYTFRPECGPHGGFAPPPLFDYFILDAETCSWIPPVPYPSDGSSYAWDDPTRSWVKLPGFTVIG